MISVASRRANSPSSRSREHGDLRSAPTKRTIASVPTREFAPAESLGCRITCGENAEEFDSRRGEGREAGLESSIEFVAGGRGAAYDAVKETLEGKGP